MAAHIWYEGCVAANDRGTQTDNSVHRRPDCAKTGFARFRAMYSEARLGSNSPKPQPALRTEPTGLRRKAARL